uniref:Uncharacterized protein n=1 Tax=Panagrellus redivivus TaxID=6233 RepID=A0A7E4VVK8_PANRE
MHFIVFVVYFITRLIQATDIAREIEGGVQLLSTGPIQLIIPEILTFTIRNEATCIGDFYICYVSDPTVSREEKRQRYRNVGHGCPHDRCTLVMEVHGGVYGLAVEKHDGNFYGMLVKGSKHMCPLYFDNNGRSNFIVKELPTCPVIVDGAMIPKDETTEPSQTASMNWIIPVCVGLGILLLVIAIVGVFIYCRSKRSNAQRPHSVERNQRISKSASLHERKLSNSRRKTLNPVVSTSPRKPALKSFPPASAKSIIPTGNVSNSASSNEDA